MTKKSDDKKVEEAPILEEAPKKIKSKFLLDKKNKHILYEGKKILKQYKEGSFTVTLTEDGTTYKNIS